jgi:hypothetical protein
MKRQIRPAAATRPRYPTLALLVAAALSPGVAHADASVPQNARPPQTQRKPPDEVRKPIEPPRLGGKPTMPQPPPVPGGMPMPRMGGDIPASTPPTPTRKG